MVKNFKGEVKISDVKTEFDNLVDRINNMVDSYNISGKVEDIDYTVGGVNLSPAGYTLSVGGLKKGLEAVERNVIGAKCFKVGNNKIKITDGLVLTKKGAIRLPDAVIDKSPNYNTLYFNSLTNQYQWVGGAAYREETRVKEFRSYNVMNPDTGLYHLVDPETHQSLYPVAAFSSNAYRPYNIPNTNKFNTIDEVLYEAPRFYNDPESIVQKIKTNISRYQWIPLSDTEIELKDVVFDMDKGDGGVIHPYWMHCDGIVLGKYEYNENNTGFDTFDPRIGFYFNHSGSYYTTDTNRIGIKDYTSRTITRAGSTDDAVYVNESEELTKSMQDSNLSPLYGDIGHIRVTFEEHNSKFMMIVRWTLDSIKLDHYEGDLYSSDGIKYDYDKVYFIMFLDDNYKNLKVGNVALLSAGYESSSSVPIKYNLALRFDPELYRVNGKKPVTDKDNIYYTILIPTEDSEDVFRICDININRDSKFVSDLNTVQAENFDGYYKITSESKTFGSGGTLRYSNVSLDPNKPNFISGIDAERFEREGTSRVYLLGDQVAWNYQTGHRNLNYWTPVNMLFLPKGISNPFGVSNGDASKSFKVIIDKKVE